MMNDECEQVATDSQLGLRHDPAERQLAETGEPTKPSLEGSSWDQTSELRERVGECRAGS